MRDYLLYIDGAWRPGGAGSAVAASPSSGETFATVAVASLVDVDDAVRAASAAWPEWAGASPFERSGWFEKVIGGIRGRREELARALTLDQGKPLAEAFDEVDELAEYFRMAGEDAKRRAGALPASVSAGRRILTLRVPLGVIGVVSPWNWPYTMGAEVFAPAIAAGNTVVWVPAPSTTACCAVLAEAIADTGMPAAWRAKSTAWRTVSDAWKAKSKAWKARSGAWKARSGGLRSVFKRSSRC
jgi:acyl-CoA reductase-like NAD-dependent aldehyde dehydrogenase